MGISRRNFLFVLASLPFVNSFQSTGNILDNELFKIAGSKGVITLANINSGQIIGCSNLSLASKADTIGSISKILTSFALMDKKVIRPEDYYNCHGSDIINGKKYNCWKLSGHGKLNLVEAISESCNLYFYKHAHLIAPDDLLNYYRKLHLDTPELALETSTYEKSSVPLSSKNELLALGLDKNLRLNSFNILSLACTLARKGVYKPLWLNTDPKISEDLKLDKSNTNVLIKALTKATQTGTSKPIGKTNISAAAKTGTAKNPDDTYHGWCTGFAPVDKPEIAFCVYIKNGTGYSNAAPMAAKTLELCKQLNYL